jgi:predicted CXXCH cytochrome family protein
MPFGPLFSSSRLRLAFVASVLSASALAACSGPTAETRPAVPPRTVVASNVLRADYAGSKSCEPCHADLYAKWSKSPMRRMTRRLDETQIDARFDGRDITFHDDVIKVIDEGGRKYMRITSATHQTTTLFRVTKVIGGRYREDFVGVEVPGTGPNDKPIGDPNDEPVLPLSWIRFDSSWRYKGYSVMAKERPRIERGRSWRQTCIFCHNTTPLLSTIYDDLLGPSAKTYQGSISDNLLPASRRWSFAVHDDAALAGEVGREIQLLTKSAPASENKAAPRLAEAIHATEQAFHEDNLVEVGIGCEACHGGSRDHVAHPERKPSYSPIGDAIELKTGSKTAAPTHAEEVNHVCARCHTVLFSRYPWTWEGGERRKAQGGSSINSGEARDFLLGHCSGQMACTSCHDPHTEDGAPKLEALATVAGNKVCLGCHQKLGAEAALAKHTHHQPTGEGSSCVACHMPRKNTGLSYRLTRYHRIGSPSEKVRVENDRPLECALCHQDKTVQSIVETMEGWFGKKYDRGALEHLYGKDLGVNALEATLLRGKPHEQMAVAGILGELVRQATEPKDATDKARRHTEATWLSPLLTVDYPLERYYAKDAMERLEGRRFALDLNLGAATITRESSAWLAAGGR